MESGIRRTHKDPGSSILRQQSDLETICSRKGDLQLGFESNPKGDLVTLSIAFSPRHDHNTFGRTTDMLRQDLPSCQLDV